MSNRALVDRGLLARPQYPEPALCTFLPFDVYPILVLSTLCCITWGKYVRQGSHLRMTTNYYMLGSGLTELYACFILPLNYWVQLHTCFVTESWLPFYSAPQLLGLRHAGRHPDAA
jgi:hypothetical protein